jgi:hypothetical protein
MTKKPLFLFIAIFLYLPRVYPQEHMYVLWGLWETEALNDDPLVMNLPSGKYLYSRGTPLMLALPQIQKG